MNLSYQETFDKTTELSGKPTYFIESIWAGIVQHDLLTVASIKEWLDPLTTAQLQLQFPNAVSIINNGPPVGMTKKIHTIQTDEKKRWNFGQTIHHRVWTGKPYDSPSFQFTPLMACLSVQPISIKWMNLKGQISRNYCEVWVGDKKLNYTQLVELSQNDGFEHLDDFFTYFHQNLEGSVIHWTNKKY